MLLRALCTAALLSFAPPAQAQFLDCMAEGYLETFPEATGPGGLACLELFRFAADTPGGQRHIRGIMDAGADWAAPPAMVAEVERGARLAAGAFDLIGRFEVDNITILLLDDAFSFEDLTGTEPSDPDAPRGVLGVALSRPELPPGASPECLITIYALAPGASDGALATTAAHEMFHCIQGATYAGPKYDSYFDGGAWWIEGAAEAFAAAVVPESAAFTDRSADFDAGVEGRVALNEMEHEAVQFFYWLMQTDGNLTALMPFQDVMADSGGAAAQHAAMRAARSPDQWAAFAQAYADSTIRHPQGGMLGSVPPEGEVLTVDAAGSHDLPMDPFTLTLGRADFACGVWGNTPRPTAPTLSWKAEEDWQALPEELDTREGARASWQLVAMPVEDGPGSLTVERRRSCAPCQGTDAIDACLVGTWTMSGGGAAEWMRAQGFPGEPRTSGNEQMVLTADGGFASAGFEVSIDAVRNGVTFDGDGSVLAARGRWSAEDGTVNFCVDLGGGASGTVTITTNEGSGDMAVGVPGGGAISMRYSCTGGSMTTELEMPRLPTMVTTYSKIAE
jgi:hypothetical protein